MASNNSIDNNNPIISNPATSFLSEQVTFNISGVYTQDDGYVDPSKVQITLADINNDGIPDLPYGFDSIVSINDRVVFEYYTNSVTGFTGTRPWICNWDNSVSSYTGDLYLYFPADPNDNTQIYGVPFISTKIISDVTNPSNTAGAIVIYLDSADLIILNNLVQLSYNGVLPTISIANQVTAFFNLTADTAIPSYTHIATYYPWLLQSALLVNKIDILNNYILNKVFLQSSSQPGYGVYNTLSVATSPDSVSYPTNNIFTDNIDSTHYDRNGKSFTQNTNIPVTSRLPLQYKWKHYSPIDQRVDPSPSNIIDMIVITNSYYTDMINWKSNNGSLLTLPVAPTTEDLRVQFQDLDQYKMLSDAMVWNSGKFKLLFGPQAATELQATFMVIKAPATNTTDYEVKTGVIQAIDTYFDIRNWDFGEQFYYTELAAFIHQQLSTVISSVVIVPANASQFGNLFEITSAPQEIFMSTATVNNVQIVTNYTNQI